MFLVIHTYDYVRNIYYQRLKTVEVSEIWLKTIATWVFGIRLSLEIA